MSSYKKRLITLISVLVFALSACGNNHTTDSPALSLSQEKEVASRPFSSTLIPGVEAIPEKSLEQVESCEQDNTEVEILQIIPPKYANAGNFSEGMAWVLLSGLPTDISVGDLVTWKYGFIDKTGQEIIPSIYNAVEDFSEGMALVNIGMINEVYRIDDDSIDMGFFDAGKWGFIDMNGKEIIPCKYSGADSFSDGLARIRIGNKWGFVDKTGTELVECKYDSANSFSEGLARVSVGTTKWTIKYGFIDKTGHEIIPCKYDFAHDFSDGFAKVGIDGKYGFIDKAGNEVVPLGRYDSIQPFSDGMAMVQIGDWQDGECGYINTTGKESIEIGIYDIWPLQNIDLNFNDDMAIASISEMENGKLGYIDKTGQLVVPCKYDWAFSFSEGFGAVNIGAKSIYGGGADFPYGGKWGFIDKGGKEVVPPIYDYVSSFSEGFAAVNIGIELLSDEYSEYFAGGKWGFIDKNGKVVVPLIYDEVSSFSNGMARVKADGKWGYISIQ